MQGAVFVLMCVLWSVEGVSVHDGHLCKCIMRGGWLCSGYGEALGGRG